MFSKFRQSVHIEILLALTVAVLNTSGCYTYHWRDFNPHISQLPITMFGRYGLDIEGYASGPHMFYVAPYFTTEISDTNSIDTIPVFVIDTLCIFGNCLSEEKCYVPEVWINTFMGDTALGDLRKDRSRRFRKVVRRWDLWMVEDSLSPVGFRLKDIFRVPEYCSDSSLSLIIKARLIDRITREVIVTETKTVKMLIVEKKKRILPI